MNIITKFSIKYVNIDIIGAASIENIIYIVYNIPWRLFK